MEKAYNITQCDCCGIEKKGTFADLERNGWVKLSYKSTWQSGIHKGIIDHEKTVCHKCDRGEGFRFFYLSIKHEIKQTILEVLNKCKIK